MIVTGEKIHLLFWWYLSIGTNARKQHSPTNATAKAAIYRRPRLPLRLGSKSSRPRIGARTRATI
jgi:hypothetical protein